MLWSLAVEEHFYLLFPLAYAFLHRAVRRTETQALILLAACAAVLAWRFVVVLGLGMPALLVSTAVASALYYAVSKSPAPGCASAWRA